MKPDHILVIMLAAIPSSIPVSLSQQGIEKNNDGELLSLACAGDTNSKLNFCSEV
jgi:hypothetical protein